MLALGQHDHRPRPFGATAALGLGCGLLLGAVLLAAVPPAGAADREPKPMLSISVDNGGTSADVGDTLDYTIVVENTGAAAVKDLRVTQTMPEGLGFESADRGGTERPGLVVWSVDLAAGSTRELQATMTVGETPKEVLRMASVACASLASTKAPLVCATHSDELPAGSAARKQGEAAEAAEAAGSNSAWTDSTPVRMGLLGGAAAALALVLVVLKRRRPRVAAESRGPVRHG